MALNERQARAMAYRLVDEIETMALAIMARNPAIASKGDAMALAIEAMANG